MKLFPFIYKQAMLHVTSLEDLAWVLFYPFVSLLSLGMLGLHLQSQGVGTGFLYFVMVGVFSWNFMQLSQKATTYSLLYDIWGNCLRYTFLAPIKLWEFVLGNALFGLASATFSFFFMQLVAYYAFDFSFLGAGWVLLPSALSIWLFATAVGMGINGLVLRKGYQISFLAWTTVGLTMILSGVYYPIEIFPGPLQTVAKLIPITHVIGSLRGVLLEGKVLEEAIFKGLALSALYTGLTFLFLERSVEKSKEISLLSNW